MYEKFAKLLDEHNVTAYQVSKATGIASSTFYEWRDGRYEPKVEKVKKIADYFNVPLTYFYE